MVRIAIEGCCHGELDKIYGSLSEAVELLIICGDFQALRNKQDLETISVPPKYKAMGDFHRYYSGETKAPVLTIVIGGNHECSSYLRELQFGGWLAPNIYYLGDYGAVWYKGIKICGVSGIFNHHSFVEKRKVSYSLPYDRSTLRSVYHVKPKTQLKLLLSGTADICLSHDWPQKVWEWGDLRQLLRKKPFFKEDITSGRLGSPLAGQALHHLRPRHWYSSHLHTKFTAVVRHNSDRSSKRQKVENASAKASQSGSEAVAAKPELESSDLSTEKKSSTSTSEPNVNSAEISLDMDDSGEIELDMDMDTPRQDTHETVLEFADETRFLALDKCLPKRQYLVEHDVDSVVSHPSTTSDKLFYDTRAVAIQKIVENLMRSPQSSQVDGWRMLDMSRNTGLLAELTESVEFEMRKYPATAIPENFVKTAPDSSEDCSELKYWPNPQTEAFCDRFGVPLPDLNA